MIHTFISLLDILFQVIANYLKRSYLVKLIKLENELAGLFDKIGSFFSVDWMFEFFFSFGVSEVPWF